MKEFEAERWRQARKRGFRAWVVQRGVLGWGLPMCIGIVFVQSGRHPDQLANILLLNVSLGLGLGALFGVLTWYAKEWQYNRYEKMK